MVYLILKFDGTLDSNMVNAVPEDVQALDSRHSENYKI